jgi:hypothetical protein
MFPVGRWPCELDGRRLSLTATRAMSCTAVARHPVPRMKPSPNRSGIHSPVFGARYKLVAQGPSIILDEHASYCYNNISGEGSSQAISDPPEVGYTGCSLASLLPSLRACSHYL